MKVKIFTSEISDTDLENKIAEWTSEINREIISVNVNVVVKHNYFEGTAPPMICNTWYEYIATIIYKV